MNETVAGRGITGSTLKLIAIVAMLVDHIGAAIVERIMIVNGYLEAAYTSQAAFGAWMAEHRLLCTTDLVMRAAGRIAFPIFCFLLVEGFQRTRDVKKYALRLGLFALISEVPFDLAFRSQVLEFRQQNVFFTLFLGLLVMIAFDRIRRSDLHVIVKVVLDAAALAGGILAADMLQTDYHGFGVLCIVMLYLFRENRRWQAAAGIVTILAGSYLMMGGLNAMFSEMAAVIGFLPIYFYNGRRGLRMKYVFYLFYPVHLLILYGLCTLMGLQAVALL